MAGKPQFDEEKARQGLVKAFTALGFHGASLSQIEMRTGLQRSSLYNSFGGKSALFIEALKDYCQSTELKHLRALEGRGLVEGFRAVFESQLRDLKDAGSDAGCLTTCAMNEMPYDDESVQNAILETVDAVQAAIETRLTSAISSGELRPSTDVAELRDFLFGATRAIPFLHRSDPSGNASRHFANGTIKMLLASTESPS
ncbi:MAG: TetR/AcrR family transcriptional regulator [Pseudomonadota bacterium]